jgi:Rps23 Pro-64 3,4-dihydroxylase Tpa1-like proline 4-hydroxylase
MITTRLQVPLSEFQPTKIHALVSRNGDFFRAHRDTSPRNNRRITFLYYLYEAPRRFTGGDLVLYDSRTHLDCRNVPDSDSDFHPSLYTRLPCTDNELVCFPSEYYHEVLAVAELGDDTRGARIAINGWFLATDASQAGEVRYDAGG